MLHKLPIFLGIPLIIGAVILSLWPSSVSAQCGVNPEDPSCITCHEIQDPIYDKGEWHNIHARKDCCTNCHGGNCSAAEKEQAHIGMILNPLDDIYTNCHACHPDNYEVRAARFAAELGIKPSSRETPTPVPLQLDRSQPPELDLPADLSSVPASQPPIVLINVGLLLLATLFFSLIRLGKRE
jgi:hypothetical protein